MRTLAVLFLCFSLAGCFTAGKRGGDAAMMIYDFGPLPAQRQVPDRRIPMALEVKLPLWFDSLGITYRLMYAEPARLREYTRARWAGPVSQMIQRKLIRQLGFVPSGQGRANCLLRIEIDEFSQTFATTDQSDAILQGSMRWLDRKRGLLHERPFGFVLAGETPDARGGVAALTALISQLTVTIDKVEREADVANKLAGCAA